MAFRYMIAEVLEFRIAEQLRQKGVSYRCCPICGIGRIGLGKGLDLQHLMALLVKSRGNDADGQGYDMNGKEKEQYPIFCVPAQKQKNKGAKSQ